MPPNELLDQRRQTLDGAIAGLRAAMERVDEAERVIAMVTHNIELYRVNIADDTLIAPKDGRIEYRIANVGEVLPAGGKVFTMLDLSYVDIGIYLPTMDAGRAASATTRASSSTPIQISPSRRMSPTSPTEAQFTPKAVETRRSGTAHVSRQARIDCRARWKGTERMIRTGLPGVTYVRLDPKAEWPARLNKAPAR